MFFVGGLGSGHKSHILEPPRNVSKLRSMVKVLVRTPFYGWQGRRHSQADNIVSVSNAFCGQNFFFHKSNQMGNWWFSNLWPHEEYDMRRHHCMLPFQVMSDVSIFLFSPDEDEGQIASLLRSTIFQNTYF